MGIGEPRGTSMSMNVQGNPVSLAPTPRPKKIKKSKKFVNFYTDKFLNPI